MLGMQMEFLKPCSVIWWSEVPMTMRKMREVNLSIIAYLNIVVLSFSQEEAL
jgi:hypothetical protein